MTLVVITLETVPVGLRGDLTRWLLQPAPGVFIGDVTADVRARLWSRVCEGRRAGACVMVSAAANEQGFELRQHGDRVRALIDMDGLALVRLPPLGT